MASPVREETKSNLFFDGIIFHYFPSKAKSDFYFLSLTLATPKI